MKMKLPDMKAMAVKTVPTPPANGAAATATGAPANTNNVDAVAGSPVSNNNNNNNNNGNDSSPQNNNNNSNNNNSGLQDETSQKWNAVETTLREIFNKEPITGSFQVLHKIVFTLATSSPQYEYDQLKKFLRELVRSQRDSQIMFSLRNSDGALLTRLAHEYEKFSFAINKYSHLFLHLDRHWCPAQRVPGVVALGRDVFGQTVVLPPASATAHSDKERQENAIRRAISDAISDTFLQAIERERNGEDATAHNLLKTICCMVLEVGHQSTLNRLIIEPFMKQSLQFFEQEASRLLAGLPAPEYLAAYRDRAALEAARCQNVFPAYRYTQAVLDAMTNTYVKSRKTDILSQSGSGGMKQLAANWKLKEISIIFRALAEISSGYEVVDVVCQHLLAEYNQIAVPPKTVSSATSASSTTAATAPAPAATPAQSALAVMNRCMQLIDQGKQLIQTCFVLENGKGDKDAEGRVTKTVDMILNADDLISEQLAIHHDAVIRSQPTEDELEKCCDNVVSIFTRLRNKDVFEITMKTFLARRMLSVTKSQTEEEHKERILINMLKREVGASVTSKFEGMFHDKRTSEEVCATFHRKLESRNEKLPVDIDVVVVTDGLWPQLPVLPLQRVPKEIQRSIQLFSHFYMGMHKGRRLDFLYSQGTADIRLNIPGVRKPYELNIPTFCLPVILLFQADEDVYTMKAVGEKTGMNPQDAGRAIFSLCRSTAHFTGVLVTDSPQQGISAETVVQYNKNFKSKTNKVKYVAAVAKSSTAPSSSSGGGGIAGDGIGGRKSAQEIVTEDRKFRVDATIVKIMKSRRAMGHKQLVNESITMLKSGFAATADQIKARIENLIDREFLVRTDEGDGYIYKA